MKNSTILKDELSIFKADKSAVVAELRKASEELKVVKEDVEIAKQELTDVHLEIKEDLFKRDSLRAEANKIGKELEDYTQGVKNMRSSFETLRVKNAQENKLHLGRIKELGRKEEELTERISLLKKTFDNNHSTFAETIKEQEREIRNNKTLIKETETNLKFVTKALDEAAAEEKKQTKERLKKEDKIRAREKALEIRESVAEKKEHDLETMAKDILIVYGRLKAYYSKVDPDVDLDKLILNAT